MNGETDLEVILRGLAPQTRAELYVFCTVQDGTYGDFAQSKPLACFQESEGLTLVLTQGAADREGLRYAGTFRCITLGVHSSLEAVGLTAAISSALAADGISANMMAGVYHDHLFVPSDRLEQALQVLNGLTTK